MCTSTRHFGFVGAALGRTTRNRRRNDSSHFDDRLLSLAIAKYKQVLMKLEDKLRSAEDVSAANGFARETNISDLWKSLFDEEAGEATHKVIKDRILSELFQPILGESWHSEIQTIPVYSPYIVSEFFFNSLRSNFATQEMREEIVRLGVELSLFVAESMFLLCDNIRKNIKLKNGVYHTGGKLGKWELIRTTWKDFDEGIRDLHDIYLTIEVKGY
ncbi:hypothetical protein ARALYDRAFT_337930 [Arabidopsis lyrata subsp. lyrata]|uniref:Uncharacterized protein n=1 Tax=Arabidopsis lyrata subsp. lyrata TaxID=81972 RepID=D7KS93_ARALL|nr:hypothetical protein ARALYDRAFT_337930 [Arabidopsis lyrata subsp. lyrata]